VTLSIVDFLRERIQEDEDAANTVNTPYRLYVYDDGQVREPEVEDRADSDGYGAYRVDAYGDDVVPNRHCGYALLYDPARVLREVTAKRALLDVYEIAQQTHDILGDGLVALDRSVRALAAIYSDHESYREEWKP